MTGGLKVQDLEVGGNMFFSNRFGGDETCVGGQVYDVFHTK